MPQTYEQAIAKRAAANLNNRYKTGRPTRATTEPAASVKKPKRKEK